MPNNNNSDSEQSSQQYHPARDSSIPRYMYHAEIEVSCSLNYFYGDHDEEEQISHITYERSSDLNYENREQNSSQQNYRRNYAVNSEQQESFDNSVLQVRSRTQSKNKKGLNAYEILIIPKMMWSIHNKNLNSTQTCGICLNYYELNQNLRVLKCLHRFHLHCIDRWLGQNNTCPSCRHAVHVSNQ